ncbi:sensor histidine kinase [Tumebacillus permanentifrigoris]|uniref:Heme sensor protein HssS n=1 Tax=Tumebacillus permanentifrigoris TaxID=378543 RepID=A0A316DDL3_9BACL|nr:HAMP domain-containing sensor histidine kinase [Tumebacillus permanentifrigoris]PWK14880.1 signal transduction histidine kinase [Tumebacillus permanentifrigoris]
MRTLYFRIVITMILIVVSSSAIAFLLSNFYYQHYLKAYNEQKLMSVLESAVEAYEAHPTLPVDEYLTNISHYNYQVYAVDEHGHGVWYGAPFHGEALDPAMVQQVREGEKYHGILEHQHGWLVIGFFQNTLANSVGMPLHAEGQTYAVFLRPNIERMFGEVRDLLRMMVVYTSLLSVALLIIGTRYLVKPIKRLTGATQQLAAGEFDIRLDLTRRDEIGELAQHFAQMAEQLKKVDAMRQEFVANVSHEIQSPLTSIKGFSQALRTAGLEREEQESYLAIIEAESERLSSLSKQLLTLASLEQETMQLERSPYRLDEQIRQAVLMLEWQWREKGIELELHLAELTVQADSQMLHLVWINLLTNSIKFTPAGGVITVQLTADRTPVHVQVRDTGVGIPPAELPRVFERFYKADKSRNRTRSGSGLGLAIVHKVIRLHGGTVEVTSELGVGTEVQVKLPRL